MFIPGKSTVVITVHLLTEYFKKMLPGILSIYCDLIIIRLVLSSESLFYQVLSSGVSAKLKTYQNKITSLSRNTMVEPQPPKKVAYYIPVSIVTIMI